MSNSEKPATDTSAAGKPPAGSKIQGEGDYESSRRFRKDEENFLKTADVPDLARKAAPKSDAEVQELKQAEEAAASHAKGTPAKR